MGKGLGMLELPAMADHSTSSDDISALWGPPGEGLLGSGAPEPKLDLAAEFRSIATAAPEGNRAGDRDELADGLATLRDEVAALREELAELRGVLGVEPRESRGV